MIVDRHRYGCGTHKDRGSSACTNKLKVSRLIVEEKLLSGIKSEILSEAGFKAFEQEVRKLLKSNQPDLSSARKAVRSSQDEVDNIMNAIRQGIITSSTKAALEESESRLSKAKDQLMAMENFQPAQILPRAREIFRKLVGRLESIDDINGTREDLRGLIGEKNSFRSKESFGQFYSRELKTPCVR